MTTETKIHGLCSPSSSLSSSSPRSRCASPVLASDLSDGARSPGVAVDIRRPRDRDDPAAAAGAAKVFSIDDILRPKAYQCHATGVRSEGLGAGARDKRDREHMRREERDVGDSRGRGADRCLQPAAAGSSRTSPACRQTPSPSHNLPYVRTTGGGISNTGGSDTGGRHSAVDSQVLTGHDHPGAHPNHHQQPPSSSSSSPQLPAALPSRGPLDGLGGLYPPIVHPTAGYPTGALPGMCFPLPPQVNHIGLLELAGGTNPWAYSQTLINRQLFGLNGEYYSKYTYYIYRGPILLHIIIELCIYLCYIIPPV